jgi:hypothetical protein
MRPTGNDGGKETLESEPKKYGDVVTMVHKVVLRRLLRVRRNGCEKNVQFNALM